MLGAGITELPAYVASNARDSIQLERVMNFRADERCGATPEALEPLACSPDPQPPRSPTASSVVKRSETTGNPHQHRAAAPVGREKPVRALLAPLPGLPSF